MEQEDGTIREQEQDGEEQELQSGMVGNSPAPTGKTPPTPKNNDQLSAEPGVDVGN